VSRKKNQWKLTCFHGHVWLDLCVLGWRVIKKSPHLMQSLATPQFSEQTAAQKPQIPGDTKNVPNFGSRMLIGHNSAPLRRFYDSSAVYKCYKIYLLTSIRKLSTVGFDPGISRTAVKRFAIRPLRPARHLADIRRVSSDRKDQRRGSRRRWMSALLAMLSIIRLKHGKLIERDQQSINCKRMAFICRNL